MAGGRLSDHVFGRRTGLRSRAMGSDPTHEAFRDDPLQARWTQLKRSAVNEVRFLDRATAAEIETIVRTGVGPLLQRLERELRRFPDHDLVEVRRLGDRIARTLTTRRAKVSAALRDDAPSTSAWLSGALGDFGDEVARRLAWYERHASTRR